jgi:hypothetical protein
MHHRRHRLTQAQALDRLRTRRCRQRPDHRQLAALTGQRKRIARRLRELDRRLPPTYTVTADSPRWLRDAHDESCALVKKLQEVDSHVMVLEGWWMGRRHDGRLGVYRPPAPNYAPAHPTVPRRARARGAGRPAARRTATRSSAASGDGPSELDPPPPPRRCLRPRRRGAA